MEQKEQISGPWLKKEAKGRTKIMMLGINLWGNRKADADTPIKFKQGTNWIDKLFMQRRKEKKAKREPGVLWHRALHILSRNVY